MTGWLTGHYIYKAATVPLQRIGDTPLTLTLGGFGLSKKITGQNASTLSSRGHCNLDIPPL